VVHTAPSARNILPCPRFPYTDSLRGSSSIFALGDIIRISLDCKKQTGLRLKERLGMGMGMGMGRAKSSNKETSWAPRLHEKQT
jgi:hypothetical protein